MDQTIELLLLAQRGKRYEWEDEDRSYYDLESMRLEFQARLYGNGVTHDSND